MGANCWYVGSADLRDPRDVEEIRWLLHLGALGEEERVLDIDAQVTDRALDLCMTEQDLHSTQVARPLIDDRSLGSAERVGPVVLPAQPNPGHPLINEASVLPGADMIDMINPARKDEVDERTSSAFEPSEDAGAGRLKELELNGATGLLLNNDRSRANPAATDKLADLYFNDITSTQLTVDREIEHCTVAQPAFSIQPEPDSPDLLRLKGTFTTNL